MGRKELFLSALSLPILLIISLALEPLTESSTLNNKPAHTS